MKKHAAPYVIIVVLALVFFMSGCQYDKNNTTAMVIDLSMDAEGFWVAQAEEVGTPLSEPQFYTGKSLSDEINNLMQSKVLKTVTAFGSYWDEATKTKYFDEEKQREILLATDLIKNNEGIYLGLQDFKMQSECLGNPNIASLSLVDCEVRNLEACNVKELKLTRCNDMDWDKLNSFKFLTHLYIDPVYAMATSELISEGYYPDSFDVFSDHASLTDIKLIVHGELPGGEFVLTKEDLSGYASIEKLTPFTIEDIKQFLNNSDKRIVVRIDAI